MTMLYQDAMAIVRNYGKPDLFITYTCNPLWKDIRENMPQGQTVKDRQDLTVCVFRLKLKELLKDLTKDCIFGRCIAHMHVIEFQKRGLPHAHILIILHPEDKLRTVEQYDDIVCAEIPDPNSSPQLYQIVSRCMMHGPVGSQTKIRRV